MTETWHIVVRAKGKGPPLSIRVRRFLKTALRAHGLKAVDFPNACAVPRRAECKGERM